jgi:hypothetical protein
VEVTDRSLFFQVTLEYLTGMTEKNSQTHSDLMSLTRAQVLESSQCQLWRNVDMLVFTSFSKDCEVLLCHLLIPATL